MKGQWFCSNHCPFCLWGIRNLTPRASNRRAIFKVVLRYLLVGERPLLLGFLSRFRPLLALRFPF